MAASAYNSDILLTVMGQSLSVVKEGGREERREGRGRGGGGEREGGREEV